MVTVLVASIRPCKNARHSCSRIVKPPLSNVLLKPSTTSSVVVVLSLIDVTGGTGKGTGGVALGVVTTTGVAGVLGGTTTGALGVVTTTGVAGVLGGTATGALGVVTTTGTVGMVGDTTGVPTGATVIVGKAGGVELVTGIVGGAVVGKWAFRWRDEDDSATAAVDGIPKSKRTHTLSQ